MIMRNVIRLHHVYAKRWTPARVREVIANDYQMLRIVASETQYVPPKGTRYICSTDNDSQQQADTI